MSAAPGDPEDAENLGANTDQDGATPADQAENLGANTEEDGTSDQTKAPADAPKP